MVRQGEPNFRTVRVIFRKNGSDWQAFPGTCPDQDCLKTIASKHPQEMTWTIAFDGKNLGQVTSRAPKEFEWYASVGQEEVTTTVVPTIGQRSDEFGGFVHRPVYRPLVADSQPYFKDPDRWKLAKVPSDLAAALRAEFRRKFPSVTNCDSPEENIRRPWHYGDDNIKMLRFYMSRNNWSVAELQLDPDRCDGFSGDSFSNWWFTISPQGTVSILDGGMQLVDAGDYDDDGRSELLFSIDRDDLGGYELFYDDFSKHVTFSFAYH